MKGRKKIPDSLKTLRGTDQPCRMSNSVAIPPTTAVVALPRTGLKGTAKKIFAVVATELIHKGLLDVTGVDLVVAYAREMALYHDSMRDVEREGATVEIETKQVIRHGQRKRWQSDALPPFVMRGYVLLRLPDQKTMTGRVNLL